MTTSELSPLAQKLMDEWYPEGLVDPKTVLGLEVKEIAELDAAVANKFVREQVWNQIEDYIEETCHHVPSTDGFCSHRLGDRCDVIAALRVIQGRVLDGR
jgi:hypothetical protein